MATKVDKKKGDSGFGWYVTPRLGCFGIKSEPEEGKGSFDREVPGSFRSKNPDHLIVMVNGLIGSAHDWKFAAEQLLKKYPNDVVVHCSECNYSLLTFDGVDVMGERLADEVISVIKHHPSARKISFVAHSMGGLIARYAIARLFERDIKREDPSLENGDRGTNVSEISCPEEESLKKENAGPEPADFVERDPSLGNGDTGANGPETPCPEENLKGKIAGLEPVNFITSATPHLGTWGHKQVPVFCGLYSLERVAARTSGFLGKSGKHLFLSDGGDGRKPPLLLRMASDCEDLKFISALKSFRRRVAYANMRFDHLVGWSTSSLRRRNELPKLKKKAIDDRYPHIINVEPAKIATQEEVSTEPKAGSSKSADMEEDMLKSLTRLSWERIDVSFHGSRQRYLAHNTIQVKGSWMNSDGADVIQHMVDNFLL